MKKMVFELDKVDSIANQFLAELRDKGIQQDRLRFRRNLERLGEVMAYEVSKSLKYKPQSINTGLGTKKTRTIQEQPVLITILRAGLPFFKGFENYFDGADAGFIGAFRVEDGENMSIQSGYMAMPQLNGKVLILVDPMLATGQSIVRSLEMLTERGTPAQIHVVSAIAAPEGIEHLINNVNKPLSIWVGSIDEQLDENAYIVPGLGDAGDLSFGRKLD